VGCGIDKLKREMTTPSPLFQFLDNTFEHLSVLLNRTIKSISSLQLTHDEFKLHADAAEHAGTFESVRICVPEYKLDAKMLMYTKKHA
jgi:hypothetical protein